MARYLIMLGRGICKKRKWILTTEMFSVSASHIYDNTLASSKDKFIRFPGHYRKYCMYFRIFNYNIFISFHSRFLF